MRVLLSPRMILMLALYASAALFAPPMVLHAAELDTLQSVQHGSVTIFEGDTVTRGTLADTSQSWTFDFSWPAGVSNSRSFLAVFRGSFGDVEGGVAVEGTNYGVTSQPWVSGSNVITKSINLPALGNIDTTSSTYTAVVAELNTDFAYADTVEWFSSGGASGVEPANYAFLTFEYDGAFSSEDLDSIHFVEHGGQQIGEGETVFQFDLTSNSSDYLFNFDWPRAVDNQRALLGVFRGTFGDLEGGVPAENENYAVQLQSWGAGNPKNVVKPIALPALADAEAVQGTYTIMVAERDPKYVDGGAGFSVVDQVEWFASGGEEGIPPLAYSFLTFEFSTIDELLLQYEPVLYLHPEENYQPMSVEAFVEASALWDDNGVLADSVLVPRGDVTIDDISTGGSEDWYLAFSSDEAKTFDVSEALNTYNQLVSDGKAKPTYYGYKTEDSFTDDEGVTHDFIVLQYWYFYAFNDWAEFDGTNNHEGDWESVFVFLDEKTEVPMYVAFSSHLNDGDPSNNPFQYGSVRRSWDEVERGNGGNKVISYVALGSHANYPDNGNAGEHIVPGVLENKIDQTSANGETQIWSKRHSISTHSPAWMIYEGKWGADRTDITGKEDGPQGPNLLAPLLGDGVVRFHEPVKWASLEKARTEKEFASNSETFENQTTSMTFFSGQPVGETVSVDLHDEIITFGSNFDSVTLLPHFRDIESSLENGTFEVEVAFQYDQEEVDVLELDESSLSVFLYNEAENIWEKITSTVDGAANTISFITSHFSRYAIGIETEVEEPRTIEDIYDDLRTSVDKLPLRSFEKRILTRYLDLSERLWNRLREHTTRPAITLLETFERTIERYERKGKISDEEVEGILSDVGELRALLGVD